MDDARRIAWVQQRDVCAMGVGRRSQDGLPQVLILLHPVSRTQQDTPIREHLRLTKLHGEGELAKAREAAAKRLPRNQLIVPAERDVRSDDGVLPWIKPLPDRLDDGALIGRQE